MAFCDQCGQQVSESARFCPSCAAPRTVAAEAPPEPAAPPPEPPPPAPEPEPEPVAQAPRKPPPQAELVDQLGRLGRTPAVVAAGVIGIGTFVVVFLVALVLAALPDRSLIGFLGIDAGYLEETFRQMVQLVLAGFHNEAAFAVFPSTVRIAPGLFALVPVLTSLYLARAQLTRLRGIGLAVRLGCAGGGALLFALLMLLPALLTGDVGASTGQAFGYGLLWTGVGAVAGTLLAAPPDPAELGSLPLRARVGASASLTALRPLGIALLVTTAIGTALWLVNVATVQDTRGSRSLPIALVDTALFTVDHGVHTFELGSLAAFERRAVEPVVLSLPVPAGEPEKVLGSGESYRLFDYRHGTPAIVFLLMLAVLVALPLATALYAGFLVARERAAATPALCAAWGAIVGPVWAVGLSLANSLLQDTLFGHAQGESVFGILLVGGALVGALGGFLAARRPAWRPRAAASAWPGR
jgi:hypothetical protein